MLAALFALFAYVSSWGFGGSHVEHKAVNLRDVDMLTFHAGRKTTGRRSSPIDQLHCKGGACNDLNAPHTIACENVGNDDTGVVWRCTAELDDNMALDDIDVNCEGFESKQDSHVLAGSCALNYSLNYKAKPRKPHSEQSDYRRGSYEKPLSTDEKKSGGIPFWFIALGIAALAAILCSSKSNASNDRVQATQDTATPQRGTPWNSGLSGDSTHHDMNSNSGPFGLGGGGFNKGSRARTSSGPGFLSGLGVGGLVGHGLSRMFGGSNRAPAAASAGAYGRGNKWGQSSDVSPQSAPRTRTAVAHGGTTMRGGSGAGTSSPTSPSDWGSHRANLSGGSVHSGGGAIGTSSQR